MRIWIDVTNSPHVLFFRPLLELLRADGHDVRVTAREYAQTLELLRAWIDVRISPPVLFCRPRLELRGADGHAVGVTAREYAQTLGLLRLHGIAHGVGGPRHGGAGALGKARAMAGRLPALRRYAK